MKTIIRKEYLSGGEIVILIEDEESHKRWMVSMNKTDVVNFPYYPFDLEVGDTI